MSFGVQFLNRAPDASEQVRVRRDHSGLSIHAGLARSVVIGVALVGAGYWLAGPRRTGRRTTAPAATAARSRAVNAIASVEDAAFNGGSWYLADARNGRIDVLDSAGHLHRAIGRRGNGPGELSIPRSVAVSAGLVYVSELGKDGITVYDTTGTYLRHLNGSGRCGQIVQLAAAGPAVFALRRCILADKRILLLVDSNAGDRLAAWAGADTVGAPGADAVPLTVPLIAADTQFVVVGEGASGCLFRFRTRDRAPGGRRCLDDVPRVATPDSIVKRLSSRWRGRLGIPAYLPRAVRIALVNAQLAVLVPDDESRSSWRRASWTPAVGGRPSPIGMLATDLSFLSAGGQLIVTETEDGISVRVAAILRP